MRLLLDTHILLWWVTADRKLSSRVRDVLSASDADVAVSAASLWEIAIKRTLGRLDIDLNELVAAIAADGFTELPMRFAHAVALQHLPRHHDDPFDRILIAQAIVEARKLVTRAQLVHAYAGVHGLELFQS